MNELYEKYYLNKLSENERKEFEKQLSSDQSVSEDYNAYVLIQDHLKSSTNINSALSNLDEVHKSSKAPAKVRSLFSQKITVAATLFLVAAAIFLMRPKAAHSNQELFAQNFTPAKISLITKGDNQEEAMAKLSQLYNFENYSQTIAYYLEKKDLLTGDSRINLMIGNAYLKTAHYEQARNQFELLDNNPNFQTEYLWYSGLSYLAEDDNKNAASQLNKIPMSSNYYLKSQEILGKIKSK